VNESSNLTPPPTWHPPWFNYCLDLLCFFMVYPIGYSLTLESFFALTFYEYILYIPDFISMVEHYNRIGYLKLFHPIHILATKQRRLALLQSKQKIPLCPLEYGVYPDVINLDRYNLFLLGLAYMSLTELLYGLLVMHLFACCISQCALDAIK
jgi:hypothetical protein